MVAVENTRERLLAAAQRLFAQGGEDATSLRAITREAGANVASVNYHFGSRDELLRLVLEGYVEPINARRLAMFDAVVAEHGDRVPVGVLLTAFLRPDLDALADLRAHNPQIARFIGRAYTQPSASVAGFMYKQFAPVAERLIPLLQQTLPKVPAVDLSIRLGFVVSIITGLFATATPSPDGQPPLESPDVDHQLARLIAFLEPGLTAPPPRGESDDHPHNP
ncbi:TetR/AcrR family transcriptional regulator [Rhodococcus jostii]|uniref:Regulatory protein, tetR family n=1 Tax=Rhodococcus jostii TaxID=132919 RepID=A0A1H5MLZ0_RHOJO|nr:TetR/AcrR family transcriptional regulator [Rhodococcus jostii]SEE89418.1 regulatory protein, tetR family [Rhodococcus jostii]